MLAVPTIPSHDSVVVRRVRRYPGFYTATLRQGYKDKLRLEQLNEQLVERIRSLEKLVTPSATDSNLITDYLDSAKATMTHIYPSYYPSARAPSHSLRAVEPVRGSKLAALMSPRVLLGTSLDLVRTFLIQEVYRRLRGAFAEEDGPFDADEEIIRIVVTAIV